MHVSRLQLENFRSFESADYAFRSTGTAVRGDNGRGKSNLLESIFFLAVAKSGRGAKVRDVVRWGAEHYVITAEVEREDHHFGIRIAYRHFPLHPDTPADGLTLEQLFAGRDIDIRAAQARMTRLMAEEGLPYGTRTMTYNSRLAQELGRGTDQADFLPVQACFQDQPGEAVTFYQAFPGHAKDLGKVLLDLRQIYRGTIV